MWTMIEPFKALEKAEIDALIEAPVLITILVGAADGLLDREERTWTERLMRTRTYTKPKQLQEYYRVVSHNFLGKVDEAMLQLPSDAETRSIILAERLALLNPILSKLDAQTAAHLYKGFRRLAVEAAEASGGFLRFGAVNPQEAKWVKLPMLLEFIMPAEANEPGDSGDYDDSDDGGDGD
ncbi:MAG: hypothetical protein J0L99_01325 [Chitinophagales bacterium]|nr:hypothetical protein [Chitinophagales bacterium]